MQFGSFGHITSTIDLPQVAFWVFFGFFLLLVWYNRRQDKREGYPMRASPFSDRTTLGFPAPPEEAQFYRLNEGGETAAPHFYAPGPMHAEPVHHFDGTPFTPIGNPLLAGIGPGAWVRRRDEPMLTEDGKLLLQPMRLLPDWGMAKNDSDLRGMRVFDWRWNEVGTVHDMWVDRGIKVVRMLEVDVASGRFLVPIYHTEIKESAREIRVTALLSSQFAEIPQRAAPDRITGQEDERLNAYFAAGSFYRGSKLVEHPAAAQVSSPSPYGRGPG